MDQRMLEIRSYSGPGYKPLIDFEAWRVALLNDDPEKYRREKVHYLERHNETDEVFALLKGCCTLYIGGCGDVPQGIESVAMEQGKLYNVKKGVWHTLTGDEDMVLLIVENANTSSENSQHYDISLDMLPPAQAKGEGLV